MRKNCVISRPSCSPASKVLTNQFHTDKVNNGCKTFDIFVSEEDNIVLVYTYDKKKHRSMTHQLTCEDIITRNLIDHIPVKNGIYRCIMPDGKWAIVAVHYNTLVKIPIILDSYIDLITDPFIINLKRIKYTPYKYVRRGELEERCEEYSDLISTLYNLIENHLIDNVDKMIKALDLITENNTDEFEHSAGEIKLAQNITTEMRIIKEICKKLVTAIKPITKKRSM